MDRHHRFGSSLTAEGPSRPPVWNVEFFEAANGSTPIETWLKSLNQAEYAAFRAAVDYVLEPEGISLSGTHWMKPLGDGLWEFRIRHLAADIKAKYASIGKNGPQPPEKILLRVFVHFYGNKVILLLHGYDKGANNSPTQQQKEILAARRRLTAWKAEQAKKAKAARRKK